MPCAAGDIAEEAKASCLVTFIHLYRIRAEFPSLCSHFYFFNFSFCFCCYCPLCLPCFSFNSFFLHRSSIFAYGWSPSLHRSSLAYRRLLLSAGCQNNQA